MWAILLGAVGLLGIGLWVLSTIAEALFGMPPWMRRDLEKRQVEAQIIDRARPAANWVWIQPHEAGEPLSPKTTTPCSSGIYATRPADDSDPREAKTQRLVTCNGSHLLVEAAPRPLKGIEPFHRLDAAFPPGPA